MKNWHYSLHQALEKQKYRAVILAHVNPDYRLKYPAEARVSSKITQNNMNIEAVKRIEHAHELRCKLGSVPSVDRPARFNRTV